jgi:DNA-binding transcriptional MerR regulator
MKKKAEIPRYRIGEYARYMGVTPDFLKHYEQFHLISSETMENGYRYYPFYQSSKLLECMKLRNYGVPIRDMGALLNDDDAETAHAKLSQRISEIEKQIAFHQAILEEYRQFSEWMERMHGKTEDWYVTECEEMYFLPHSNQYDFLEDDRIYSILKNWVSFMPMVKSCMEIRQPGGRDYSWGLIVPASFAQKHKIPINGAVKQLPAKKTLFCDFRTELYRSADSKTLPRDFLAQKHLKQLGLKTTGSLYKILLMYNHIHNDTMQENGYFMVPLE